MQESRPCVHSWAEGCLLDVCRLPSVAVYVGGLEASAAFLAHCCLFTDTAGFNESILPLASRHPIPIPQSTDVSPTLRLSSAGPHTHTQHGLNHTPPGSFHSQHNSQRAFVQAAPLSPPCRHTTGLCTLGLWLLANLASSADNSQWADLHKWLVFPYS